MGCEVLARWLACERLVRARGHRRRERLYTYTTAAVQDAAIAHKATTTQTRSIQAGKSWAATPDSDDAPGGCDGGNASCVALTTKVDESRLSSSANAATSSASRSNQGAVPAG